MLSDKSIFLLEDISVWPTSRCSTRYRFWWYWGGTVEQFVVWHTKLSRCSLL